MDVTDSWLPPPKGTDAHHRVKVACLGEQFKPVLGAALRVLDRGPSILDRRCPVPGPPERAKRVGGQKNDSWKS